jgi:2-keto-4-pentenoate hydratase
VADNASGGAFVLGGADWIPLDDLDLAAVEVTLDCPWSDPVRGRGDVVLGDPVASLAWLAHAVAARTGRPLQAGDVVMTGSLHPPVPVGGTGTVRARFPDLGTVSVVVA